MSALAIVLIAIGAVLVLLILGGLVASRRRIDPEAYEAHVARADQALEAARAADRGWDRAALESAARAALARERPNVSYPELHLILVEDRPGVEEDRAHFLAVGPDGQARVILSRASGEWAPERID